MLVKALQSGELCLVWDLSNVSDEMKILESYFADLYPNGAIDFSRNEEDIEILDSRFHRCYYTKCGGGIRIETNQSKSIMKRVCGYECRTLTSGNQIDYGQLVYFNCSTGQVHLDFLTVDHCPERNYVKYHNGAITFSNTASFSCENSNLSNNYCQMGSGVAGLYANDISISYSNMANDTNYQDVETAWIAISFNSGNGIVTKTNFVACCSTSKKTLKKPSGTFTECFFSECINYAVELLGESNNNGALLKMSFPIGCLAHTCEKGKNSGFQIPRVVPISLFLSLNLI